MSLNILLVDDSEIVRAVITKTLKVAGIPYSQLHEAGNGKEALEIMDKNWIDLVLADINMPIMTGIEMIDQMSKDPLFKSIPVIVISTEGSLTRIEELRNKGIKAYIRKPFTPEQIKALIAEILSLKGPDEERKEGV